MSNDFIRNAFLNLKDLLNIGFFIAMLNIAWLPFFVLNPAFVIMLTLFCAASMGLSLFQIKKFYASANSNVEGIFGFILNLLNSVIFGAILSTVFVFTIVALSFFLHVVPAILLGFILVNAPLLLLASTAIVLLTQGFTLGLNMLRWFESPKFSPQRSHYLQASVAALFDVLTAAVILSTVLVLVFSPLVPVFLPILAASSIFLTVTCASWRLCSEGFRNKIKLSLGIEKPLTENNSVSISNLDLADAPHDVVIADRGRRLFTTPDHLSTIKGIQSKECQKEYLIKVIDRKLATYAVAPTSEKNIAKSTLLARIQEQLRGGKDLVEIDKRYALIQQPKVFTSFWVEVGEVESILDAYNSLCNDAQASPACEFNNKGPLMQP